MSTSSPSVVNAPPEVPDAVIIGAGPAGLTAAVYLGRFRRSCVVLEDGRSRACWIPTSHNIPGFTAGIGGEEFLRKLKLQALQFGAQIRPAHVSTLTEHDGMFALRMKEGILRTRYVLLATGTIDHLPDLPGAARAVQRGLLRVCPVCDAFEAVDQKIAVITDGAFGMREAQFLRHYSDQVTLLDISPPSPSNDAALADSHGVECLTVNLSQLQINEKRVTLRLRQGERSFDAVYLALGCSPRHDLARSLNAACDEQGSLRVNAHQETSVARLYAAGDVVRGLNQVIVAAAESAIAAADIHNKLRAEFP